MEKLYLVEILVGKLFKRISKLRNCIYVKTYFRANNCHFGTRNSRGVRSERFGSLLVLVSMIYNKIVTKPTDNSY